VKPPREHGWVALFLALPLLLYLLLPTRNFYWDGVGISIDIEKGLPLRSLLYPSHLAYAVWGAWLYKLMGALGTHARALFVLQAANGILAGICVILIYKVVQQAGASDLWSALAGLTFGFSATWWRFATDSNAYVPSICLVLCSYLLIRKQKPAALAGLSLAGAMLFHELAILFLPVALLALRNNRRSIAAFGLASLGPVAILYGISYKIALPAGSWTLFPAWLTLHSPDSGFSFSLGRNIVFSIRGTLRLFFGGRLADAVPGPLSKLALIALAAALLGLAYCVWRARRTLNLSAPPPLFVLWIGLYAAFLLFWMPQNTFYRLFYLAPLIAALFLATKRSPELLGWLFAAAMFLWNLTFVTYPQSQITFNAPLRFAMAQREKWTPGTPIVFHDFNADLWTIAYFSPETAWISLDRPDLVQLDRDLEYARQRREPLWLEAGAYALIASSSEGRRWLAEHERPGELIRFRDAKHEYRFYSAR